LARQGHDCGTDFDLLGERGEIGRIHKDIRHDAVFIAEMVLGHPGIIEANLVGAQDFARDPRVHVAVRVGLRIGVGMGREQNAELHARRAPRPRT